MQCQTWAVLFVVCVVALPREVSATPADSTAEISAPLMTYFDGKEDNLLLSPLSISTCFSLIMPGTRGDTETQISAALSYPDSGRDAVYNSFNSFRASYNSKYPTVAAPASEWETPPPILQIANSIWVDQGLTLVPAYQLLVKDLLVALDFQDRTSSTALNAWVANHTYGKISSVVSSPGALPGKMIAVNAVYFKATWARQFKQSATRLGTFYASQARQTVVKTDSHFMHQVEYFQYKSMSSHQVVALPYAGTSIELVLVLPLNTASNEFSAADLTQAVAGMTRTYIALALPKFEFWADYELNEVLKSMGMVAPFSGGTADFTGLSTTAELFISKVIHKTFIAVDEFGTEAAAVTAMIMEVTSVRDPDPTPLLFQADHPFRFYIRDRADGTVLFAGRVGKPVPAAASTAPSLQADASIWKKEFGTNPTTPHASAGATVCVWVSPLLFVVIFSLQAGSVLHD